MAVALQRQLWKGISWSFLALRWPVWPVKRQKMRKHVGKQVITARQMLCDTRVTPTRQRPGNPTIIGWLGLIWSLDHGYVAGHFSHLISIFKIFLSPKWTLWVFGIPDALWRWIKKQGVCSPLWLLNKLINIKEPIEHLVCSPTPCKAF